MPRRNDANTFGVELELLVGRDRLAMCLGEQGVEVHVEDYNHRVRPHWKIVPDGSLPKNGWELVSPPMAPSIAESEIGSVAKGLAHARATVNHACGYHIHHAARHLSVAAVARLALGYNNAQSVMDMLVPMHRISQTYCMPLRYDEIAMIERWEADFRSYTVADAGGPFGEGFRYRHVNLAAISKHGTIEFRQHPGTVSENKILNWYKLTGAMIDLVSAGEPFPAAPAVITQNSLSRFLGAFSLDHEAHGFWMRRYKGLTVSKAKRAYR